MTRDKAEELLIGAPVSISDVIELRISLVSLLYP